MYKIDTHPLSLGQSSGKRPSEEPFLHDGAFIHKSRLGVWTEIGPNSRIIESVIGDYTCDAGEVSIIYTEVGKFCTLASHVCINPGNQPMHRVTQHHLTYRRAQFGLAEQDEEEFFAWRRQQFCTIGHDAWIGHGAVIMPGVKVGIGAVVGTGAVVTEEVRPYEVVVGVPARPVRRRFSDRDIERLLATEWWNWDRQTLEAHWPDLCDLETFLEKFA